MKAKLARRHAGPQGARQDADRSDRQRILLWSDRAAPGRRQGEALLTAEARALLARADARAAKPSSAWTRRAPKPRVRAFAERRSVKLGSVAQPLRAALTGRTTSPGIFDVLAVLGRTESLARLADQAAAPAAAK